MSLATSARLGRFALLRKLGEGGMGVVYVGYDEVLDRKVAVKVLHSGAAAGQWLLREAQALAKLSHPNVVPVYDVGQDAGRVFLAMELVDGQTLRARLADPKPPVETVLRLFLQAGRGLAAAHEAGLVHRDFKPDNVLVGKDGRARVVDFGIASLSERDQGAPTAVGHAPGAEVGASSVFDDGAPGRASAPSAPTPSALVTPLTQTGALMGTPAFMSPEQFQGERATPKSDQFSFSVALYTAVYGQRPFEGEHLIEVAQNVAAGELRPPPKDTGAPPWLWPIVSRGLAVRQEDRHPTLAAMLDAIEANLPRDPDLDPGATRAARRGAILVVLVYGLGVTTLVTLLGKAAIDATWKVVALGTSFLVVSASTVGLLWQDLKKSVHGRQLAAIMIGGPAMLVAHRLVAAQLGTPSLHVLAVDVLLLTCVFTMSAMLIDRRLYAVSAVGAACTAVASIFPEYAGHSLGLLSLVGLALGAYASERIGTEGVKRG